MLPKPSQRSAIHYYNQKGQPRRSGSGLRPGPGRRVGFLAQDVADDRLPSPNTSFPVRGRKAQAEGELTTPMVPEAITANLSGPEFQIAIRDDGG